VPLLSGIPFSKSSKVFFVDPANGSASNDGLTPSSALATIGGAYAKTTNNNNDVILYLAGSSGNTEAAAITWSNSYTHLIGVGAPTMVGQRARIFQAAALTGASPFITVSGSGCIFKNLYIFQGVDDNTSLINVRVSGGRNYFENVHFAGGGHVTQAINGGASLNLHGSAAENTFVNCTIGVDSVAAATGMVGLLTSGSTADIHTTRNIFKDCNFTMLAGHSGAAFVELTAITDIDRYLLFQNCNFINTGSAMAAGFVVPAGFDAANKRILLKDCMLLGVTTLDANDRGAVFGNMNDVTGADTSGVAVELVT